MLQPFFKQSDLASLTRVSRASHNAFEEHLYKKLVWKFKFPRTRPRGWHYVRRLLFKLLRRSSLASHTREVVIGSNDFIHASRALHREQTSDEDRTLIRSSVEEIVPQDADSWVERICDFDTERIVVLLLLQLTILRKLTIMEYRACCNQEVSGVVEALNIASRAESARKGRFQHLTELQWTPPIYEVGHLGRRSDIKIDLVILLQMPRLRTLSLGMQEVYLPPEMGSSHSIQAVPSSGMSALTSLCLRLVSNDEVCVANLLTCMEQLQVCRLEFYRPDWDQKLNPALIRDGLLPCRRVLRELIIDQADDLAQFRDPPPTLSIGSLKDFCALQHIEMMIEMLVEDDAGPDLSIVLPPNLKSLKVWQQSVLYYERHRGRLASMLEMILEDYLASTPLLRSIIISKWYFYGVDDAIQYEEFKRGDLKILLYPLTNCQPQEELERAKMMAVLQVEHGQYDQWPNLSSANDNG